jgi:hypothetical protein
MSKIIGIDLAQSFKKTLMKTSAIYSFFQNKSLIPQMEV